MSPSQACAFTLTATNKFRPETFPGDNTALLHGLPLAAAQPEFG